jgi:uncharacterized repeat protein (TIGR03803 family)
LATLFAVGSLFQQARSQTFSVIHNFSDGMDGGEPVAGPTLDRAGSLYGTSFTGGNFTHCPNGCGAVYKLTLHGSSWTLNPVYSFSGPDDGSMPDYGALVIGADGTLYGTALYGGFNDSGTVFNLRPRPTVCGSLICRWNETTVHEFGNGNDGFNPQGGVVFDAAGNLYGTTYRGGASGEGTVWQATRSGQSWTESVIYNFASSGDGVNPAGTLTIDNVGNLYGTTEAGGLGYGTVFQLTNSGSQWTETILYKFQNSDDGAYPVGGVVLDRAGNIYGGTSLGGQNGGGTVYDLSPSGGSYTMNVLHQFSGHGGPYNNLTIDASGNNIYGTTIGDGDAQDGSVFKLTQSNGNWTFTSLHDFANGSDGRFPSGSVAVDSQGNVFGTASSGGSTNRGLVFEITP